MAWQEWLNPEAVLIDGVGRALNGAAWDAFTGWDGAGAVPELAVPVSPKRPDGAGPFVRAFLVDGGNTVSGGFVESAIIELEAWHPDRSGAWDLLMEVRAAVHDLTSGPHVRNVGEAAKPTELPTGEDGWERFRMAVTIDLSTRG